MQGGQVVSRPGEPARLTFALSNTGNDRSGYALSIEAAGDLDLHAPDGTLAALRIGVAETPANAEPIVIDLAANDIDLVLDPGETKYVSLLIDTPASARNGQTVQLTLSATAYDPHSDARYIEERENGLGKVDTVFGDPGLDGQEHTAGVLKVLAPLLSVEKSMAVLSETREGFDCAHAPGQPGASAAVVGACLEWTLTARNAPSAPIGAQNITLVDPLPEALSFVSATAGDFDTVDDADGVITAHLAALPPGASASFTIRTILGSP